MDKKQTRRVLTASLVGSSIEWFDYFLYGTMAALVFNQLFFVNEDPTVGLMLAYASFALSFFIRPFGGIIFSHIGDRIGRKKTLVITLSLMGLATFGMGLLPTYQAIGIWAPILLITLRLVQGLGIGGEWGGALLLATEYAPPERRGFFGSIPQMGVTIGMVMGTLALWIMTLLPNGAFMTWGWRVPFILSAFLVIFGLWIRKGIDETPEFKAVQASGEIPKLPIVDTLKYHWREVLIAIGAKVVETAPFYIFGTFVVSYATTNLGFSQTATLGSVMIATVITTILIPIMGSLSDKIGRKKMYIAGAVAMALYAFPYFWMLHQGSVLLLVVATIIGLGIIWAPITAVLGTMFSEIFDAKVRYTGVTLGYQIGAALAGGTAPLVATALLANFDNSYVPVAIYIIFTALISLVSIWAVKDLSGKQAAPKVAAKESRV
ncbi:major facilitator transporter [Planococcus glaciei]|uniref:Putative proline/betaine transporter n=1 Tax=Planococcus glaciei TaxID=459472 RepID=A0A7H8QBR8_9BACL|nr:MFS transporter [Planococcus glaciei]ETP70485.1 major facilitator transporter [Planococcus glaciei CHR43]KOF10681.1 major facilitator transporter [Planococcus glaciei]MBX0315405.1 MHS family MFS transporter [Planococcus glaciei]QDY45740.1 MHS family MFS transporter [Planococcus glaciei]QKX50961.1 MHS family MFS transporter [Planococcus glaciei]